MNGSSSTNTIIHGMIVDVVAGGSIFATKFGVMGFEYRYPLTQAKIGGHCSST
jgi:hypothetical protein